MRETAVSEPEQIIARFMEQQSFELTQPDWLWCSDSNAGFHPAELVAALEAGGYLLVRDKAARVAELEAENNFVREKINAYVKSGFDPSAMGPTLDDIRYHLKVFDLEHSDQ